MQTLLEKKEFYQKNKNKLSNAIKEKIEKAFDIDFAHHSTTIEGNTLSLIETKAIIEDKISVGGKSLREIYEVANCANDRNPKRKKIRRDKLNNKTDKGVI